jgi:hypothetical protein
VKVTLYAVGHGLEGIVKVIRRVPRRVLDIQEVTAREHTEQEEGPSYGPAE